MEENQTVPQGDTNSKLPLNLIVIESLVVVIIILILGVVFFDNIKGLISNDTESDKKVAVVPTPYPTIDPQVVCARFTDLKYSLEYIKVACILDLSGQKINTLNKDVVKLKALQEINLNNNQFSIFPEELTLIPALMAIDIANNKIKTLPTSIVKLSNLQRLDLSNNEIDIIPEEIGQLKSLSSLVLTGNNIPQTEIEKIKKLLPNTQVTN